MSLLKDIPLESLKRAAEIRQQIVDLEKELESLLSGKVSRGAGRKAKSKPKKKGGKRKLSPEALERIREAQKRRWAKVKKKAQVAGGAPKKKAAKKSASKKG